MGFFDSNSSTRTTANLDDSVINQVDGGASDLNVAVTQTDAETLDLSSTFIQTSLDGGAIADAFNFGGFAVDAISENSALSFSSINNALVSQADIVKSSLGSIDQNSRVNAQLTNDAVSKSMALAGETQRSEAATALQGVNKIFLYLGGGAIILFALPQLKGMFK